MKGVLFAVLLAQASASYKLEQYAFNAGGHPGGDGVAASASFKITLDAIGEGLVAASLGSASFHADASLVSAFPAPGEVMGLVFTSKTTLTWSAEISAGSYDVYRDDACLAYGLTTPSTTDAAVPAPGGRYRYLATVKNRLGEEGTKGPGRTNSNPCP